MRYRMTRDGVVRAGEFIGPLGGRMVFVVAENHGEPVVIRAEFDRDDGLDLLNAQQFNWLAPLNLIADFTGPWDEWLEADEADFGRPHIQLTDEFLEQVAKDYLAAGRGYAKALGMKYGVAPTSVVRWMQLARQRGIITYPERKGAVGGTYVPRSERRRATSQ